MKSGWTDVGDDQNWRHGGGSGGRDSDSQLQWCGCNWDNSPTDDEMKEIQVKGRKKLVKWELMGHKWGR